MKNLKWFPFLKNGRFLNMKQNALKKIPKNCTTSLIKLIERRNGVSLKKPEVMRFMIYIPYLRRPVIGVRLKICLRRPLKKSVSRL